eukprot:1092771-Lingulodinium_polyedra.AAC.1
MDQARTEGVAAIAAGGDDPVVVIAAAAAKREWPVIDGICGIGAYELARDIAVLGRPKLVNVASRALASGSF